MSIANNIRQILEEISGKACLVAAAKTRSPGEIQEAIDAGVSIIGENYVQEAETARKIIGDNVRWHFIGHLQKNKVKKAVAVFDMIETIDSKALALEVNKRCALADKSMEVLIEINSGKEPQKSGIFPEQTRAFLEEIKDLKNLRIKGFMTMGPFTGDPEEARPFFTETKKLFDNMLENPIDGIEMKYLSMGMTNSYKVAIEEGANLVRIGTKIFGERA